MITCDTEQEWNQTFNEAKLLLRDHPTKVDELIEIHQRPSYYTGYYIRQIETNLLLLGNTSAESNHSSITKHLGECGIWTISHQISKLMERQQYFLNMDQNHVDSLFLRQESYISVYNGDLGKHDVAAKKALTSYGYTHCWKRIVNKSKNYQNRSSVNGTHNVVWKIGNELGVDNFFSFPKMGRCNCKFRVSFGCPCAHELACDMEFKITEYSIRWLCPNEFDKSYPHLRPSKVQNNQLYNNIAEISIPEGDSHRENS